MVELELIGLHSDGEHLTLAGPDGQRYQLLVNDALRAAVRRDRPQLEQLRAGVAPRPKEIQARIRAGATAQEVAEAAGLPVEHVQRYEGPVVAERNWVVVQALRFTIGRAEDSPQLEDLVVDRLAAREVPSSDLTWDAVRHEDRSWELIARFTAGDKSRVARWEVDTRSRTAHALNDEGRWLSETEVAPAAPAARRHLMPVRLHDVEADGDLGPSLAAVDADLSAAGSAQPEAGEDELPAGDLPAASTDDLLAELRATRGTRQDLDLDLGPEPDDDAAWDMPPAAHPPASRSQEAREARVLPLPHGAETQQAETQQSAPNGAQEPPAASSAPAASSTGRGAEETRRNVKEPGPAERRPQGRQQSDGAESKRRRSRRASVPSWDEIVFGARPD